MQQGAAGFADLQHLGVSTAGVGLGWGRRQGLLGSKRLLGSPVQAWGRQRGVRKAAIQSHQGPSGNHGPRNASHPSSTKCGEERREEAPGLCSAPSDVQKGTAKEW